MVQVLEVSVGVVIGLGLIAGVFWLAFRRMPDAREPPTGGFDASTGGWPGWDGGSNDHNSG